MHEEALEGPHHLHHTPEHVAALDAYLAAVDTYSPDTTPERFTTRNDAG